MKNINIIPVPSKRSNVMCYDLYVDEIRKDSGYDNQLGYMIFKLFGYNLEGFDFVSICDQSIINEAMRQYDKMIMIDEEIPSREYRWHLQAFDPSYDFNESCAQKMAYRDYKKLIKADFNASFAFTMAYAKALLEMSPEKHEVMDIIGMTTKYPV